MWFNGWHPLLRVAVSAAAVYVLVIGALRVIGARALAKMSAYDVIVTVALGSLVAAIPITEGLPLADGAAAVLTFLALQEITRFLQARFLRLHHVVRERPHLVVWDGALLGERLTPLNVTGDEVRAAVRRAGFLSLAAVQAVVLENDGEWSVMPRVDGGPSDLGALEGLDVPRGSRGAGSAGSAHDTRGAPAGRPVSPPTSL